MQSQPPSSISAARRLLVLPLLLLLAHFAFAGAKAEDKWFEHRDCKLVRGHFADGDSFRLEWKDKNGRRVERTYRLYGVDCPESDGTDKRLTQRIQQQMEHWRVDRATLLKAGKQAADFTERHFGRGGVRILTRGKLGQEVPKNPGSPQRRYALVEVLDDQREPRWLHELLLENGLARAYGKPAPWPPREEDRHGERAAAEQFMKSLRRLERPLARPGG